mgnify:CR=1 FL=1
MCTIYQYKVLQASFHLLNSSCNRFHVSYTSLSTECIFFFENIKVSVSRYPSPTYHSNSLWLVCYRNLWNEHWLDQFLDRPHLRQITLLLTFRLNSSKNFFPPHTQRKTQPQLNCLNVGLNLCVFEFTCPKWYSLSFLCKKLGSTLPYILLVY